MNRMKKRLLNVATILSALLALAAAASWARSYRVYDEFSCGYATERHRCAWQAYAASFQFSRWPPGIPEGASGVVLICFGKIFMQQGVYSNVPLQSMPPLTAHTWASDSNVIPSFSYFQAVTGDMTRPGHWLVRQVSLRHWALVLLFALLPAARLFAWRRRPASQRHMPVL
jgi:hypothetical protein